MGPTVPRSKNKLKDRSPRERLGIVALLAGAVSVVASAEYDLQRRPADEVRGSKTLWRLACLNAIGAAIYFRWGRRASTLA